MVESFTEDVYVRPGGRRMYWMRAVHSASTAEERRREADALMN